MVSDSYEICKPSGPSAPIEEPSGDSAGWKKLVKPIGMLYRLDMENNLSHRTSLSGIWMNMKPFGFLIYLFFIAGFLSGTGCGPGVMVRPPSEPMPIGEDEFSKAEKLYEQGDHKAALDGYLLYVDRFPRTDLTPAALMKIGGIYVEMQAFESARNAYEKVTDEFPGHSIVPDAEVEILVTYLNERNYIKLLERSKFIPERSLSPRQRLRVFLMKAEAFLETGERGPAVLELIEARRLVDPRERKTLDEKISAAFTGLSQMEMDDLTSRLEKPEDIDLVISLRKQVASDLEVIGIALPLSGPYDTIGYKALRGIELAFSKWAKYDNRFKIIVKDTGTEPQSVMSAVNALIAEKPACIIGPIVSAEAAAPLAQQNGIPMITMSQKDSVTEPGDYIFRNFITPRMQVKALVEYAMQTRGASRFAVLYPNETYGKTYMDLFCNEVLASGGQITGMQSYDPDITDFADPVKKLVSLKSPRPSFAVSRPRSAENGVFLNSPASVPVHDDKEKQKSSPLSGGLEPESLPGPFDAVFIPDSPKKVAMIVPQFPYNDVNNILLLGPNIWHSNELIHTAGHYIQGAVLSEGFFNLSSSPRVRLFRSEFMETYHEEPEFIEAVAYDTAMLVLQTLSRGNYRMRSEIRDALHHLELFEGVTGNTVFDSNGEAIKNLYLLSIEGNRFVEVAGRRPDDFSTLQIYNPDHNREIQGP